MVFFNHVVVAPHTRQPPAQDISFLSQWGVWLGEQLHIGVPIFFVLSGFLITTRYFHRLELTGPWFRRYLQNRFARIYPIYLLLTLLTFAVMFLRPTQQWYEWPDVYPLIDKVAVLFLNLTLTRAYFADLVVMGVPPAWTLTVEETFYLLAPFLLLGLKRNFRLLYLYPVLLLSIGVALVLFCSRFLPYYGLMADINFLLQSTFFGRCIEFLVGIGLAFFVARRTEDSQRGVRATFLGLAGIVACLVGLAWVQHTITNSVAWLVAYRSINNVLLPGTVAVLFWGLIKERTRLRQLLETTAFDLLGKSSYVFYLIHLGVIDTLFSEYITEN